MYKIKLEDILKARSIINIYGDEYYEDVYCKDKDKPYYELVDIHTDRSNVVVKDEMMLQYKDLLIKLTTVSYDSFRVIPKTMVIEILPLEGKNVEDIDFMAIDGCIGEGMILILSESARRYNKVADKGNVECTNWKIIHIDEQVLNFGAGVIWGKYDTITQPHLTTTNRYARFGLIELDMNGFPITLSPRIRYEL